jgi:hypothetical protein
MDALEEIINNAPQEEYTFVILESSGIFVPQDLHCELWKKCRLKTDTLANVCYYLNYDWERLKELGFNANFLTRNRWLDIYVLTEKLHLTLEKLMRELGVSQRQIESWHLSPEENYAFSSNGV